MSDLQPLTDYLENIRLRFDDRQRIRLTRQLSTKLKRQMAQRIRSQNDPSGSSFVPRKRNKRRAIRRGRLFQRLSRHIKTAYTANHAEVGFSGRTADVMKVHQYGLTAKPSPNARAVRYPVRETVGFSREDEQMIQAEIYQFFLDN